MKDKIAGAVYGFVIGDAMGATTEFMAKERIKEVYGCIKDIIGGGWLSVKPGDVTDDTEMTLCVMDALMRCNCTSLSFKRLVEDNFIKWLKSNPKDVGAQCYNAIKVLECKVKRDKAYAEYNPDALGNGSLMRALPCALINDKSFNKIQGRITHNNEKCSDIICDYTRLIQKCLKGKYIPFEKGLQRPTGYIVHTYDNARYWANKPTFEEAIIGAVNDGGDADTIAAIAGSIAGARFGYSNIPERWIKQLNPDVKKKLDKFIDFATECMRIQEEEI